MGVGVTGVPVDVAGGVMRVGVARGVDVRVGATVGVSVGRGVGLTGVKVGRGVEVGVGVGDTYQRGVGVRVRVGGTTGEGVISTSGG